MLDCGEKAVVMRRYICSATVSIGESEHADFVTAGGCWILMAHHPSNEPYKKRDEVPEPADSAYEGPQKLLGFQQKPCMRGLHAAIWLSELPS